MNTSPDTALSIQPVIPVHTRCRGRVRLEIRGLYRSPALQRRIEMALAGLTGIRSVRVNIVTGRMLVQFSPDITVKRLIALIELQIGVDRTDANDRQFGLLRPATQSPSNSMRFAISDALTGFSRTLRGFATSRLAQPALAIIASATSAGQPKQYPRQHETQPIRAWFAMDLSRVISELGVSEETGLAVDDVFERLRRYGENALVATEKRSDITLFIGQFNSLPVALLGMSAGVALMTGGLLDAAVILGVVLINAIIGFITERQAERTINALTQTGAREVRLLRGGEAIAVPVEQIVPGDIMLMAPGDYVAADVRLIRAHRLSVDESALTGESLPVTKDHAFVAKQDTPLGDRRNMAYMGTHVTGGNGRGLVIATAAATELGQIQTMVGEAEAPETPMQKQLGRMGTQLALLSGGVCIDARRAAEVGIITAISDDATVQSAVADIVDVILP